MLKKSNKSAIVMSTLAFLSMVVSFVIWSSLLKSADPDFAVEPSIATTPDFWISICVALAITAIVIILPGAFMIHNWSDEYFGKEGAIRWIIFGFVFGTLAKMQALIPDGNMDNSFSSFLVEKSVGVLLGFIFFYISHFVAFRLLKLKTQ